MVLSLNKARSRIPHLLDPDTWANSFSRYGHLLLTPNVLMPFRQEVFHVLHVSTHISITGIEIANDAFLVLVTT